MLLGCPAPSLRPDPVGKRIALARGSMWRQDAGGRERSPIRFRLPTFPETVLIDYDVRPDKQTAHMRGRRSDFTLQLGKLGRDEVIQVAPEQELRHTPAEAKRRGVGARVHKAFLTYDDVGSEGVRQWRERKGARPRDCCPVRACLMVGDGSCVCWGGGGGRGGCDCESR